MCDHWRPALQQIVDLDSAILGSFPSESPLRRQPTPQLNHFQPQLAEARPTYFSTPSLSLPLPITVSHTAAGRRPPPIVRVRGNGRVDPPTAPARAAAACPCEDAGVLDRPAAGHPRGLLRHDE